MKVVAAGFVNLRLGAVLFCVSEVVVGERFIKNLARQNLTQKFFN